MLQLLRRVHILVGLHASVALVLMGIAGLVASSRHGERPAPAAPETLPLAVGDGTGMRDLLHAAVREARVPLAPVPPAWALKRDADGRLVTSLYSPNASAELRIDSTRRVVEVTRQRTTLGEFLVRLHAYTLVWPPNGSLVISVWSLYMELSIAGLVFLALSSVILWWRQPRKSRLSKAALVAGLLASVVVVLMGRWS